MEKKEKEKHMYFTPLLWITLYTLNVELKKAETQKSQLLLKMKSFIQCLSLRLQGEKWVVMN